MLNVIISGFATDRNIFSDFIKLHGDCLFIDNPDFSYVEVKSKLDGLDDKLNIFGWSLGSIFALKWTLDNHDKVNSLFLTGATGRFTEKAGYENGIKSVILQKMIRLIKLKPVLVLQDFYNKIFENVTNRNELIEVLIDIFTGSKTLINGLNELENIDLLDRLVEINVPTLICNGLHDPITPPFGAEYLNNNIKGSDLFIYEGGHSFFLENPETCIKMWKTLYES